MEETSDVAFPWDTGGCFRLKATVLYTGQPWGIPHVQRCKSAELSPNEPDLSVLFACKWIYVYTDSIQSTVAEGLATPVVISTEQNSITVLLNSS